MGLNRINQLVKSQLDLARCIQNQAQEKALANNYRTTRRTNPHHGDLPDGGRRDGLANPDNGVNQNIASCRLCYHLVQAC
jgi:hypothetical protein